VLLNSEIDHKYRKELQTKFGTTEVTFLGDTTPRSILFENKKYIFKEYLYNFYTQKICYSHEDTMRIFKFIKNINNISNTINLLEEDEKWFTFEFIDGNIPRDIPELNLLDYKKIISDWESDISFQDLHNENLIVKNNIIYFFDIDSLRISKPSKFIYFDEYDEEVDLPLLRIVNVVDSDFSESIMEQEIFIMENDNAVIKEITLEMLC